MAQLYQYQGQRESAASLLAEAAQLPFDSSDWGSRFETSTQIALAYAALGQADNARQVLTTAKQTNPAPAASVYPVASWVSSFAKIGAFDRAMQLLSDAPINQRDDARFRLATVYVDRGQYDSAITLLSQIPDGVLQPSSEYPDPKLELFARIINETLKQGAFDLAKRVAQIMKSPEDRVRFWAEIAAAYQEKQQSRAATDVLDRALALANTIEKRSFGVNQDDYFETSNAYFLLLVAKGYWAAGQREQAIATAEGAIASIKSFRADNQFPNWERGDFGTIAELGRDWQAPELYAAALREVENQLEEDIKSGEATSDNQTLNDEDDLSSRLLVYLIKLAYEPNQAPSELFSRNLTRLEDLLDQITAPEQQLFRLHNLAYLYGQIDRPEQAKATIAQILALIEPLSARERDAHYARLARVTMQVADLEDQLQILPRLSSVQKQTEVLSTTVMHLATEDKTALSIKYFDRLIQLSEKSLGDRERDDLLSSLANDFSHFFIGEAYSLPPRTVAKVALMTRLPQYISDPQLRAVIWLSFVPNLPPTETAQAYEAISTILT